MSNQAITWAYSVQGISSTQKFILITLANYANENDECFPGIERLSYECCLDRRTVIRAIQDLEKTGYLRVDRRGGDGSGRKSNVYKLLQSDNLTLSQKKGEAKWHCDQKTGKQSDIDDKQSDTRPPYPPVITKIPPPIVPPQVDEEAWTDLCEYRETHPQKKIRDAWTDKARSKAAKLLAECSPEDQQRCVDMTIANGWQGIFPERLKNGKSVRKNAGQVHQEIYREIATAGSLDRGHLREDEITLRQLMDEEQRRRESQH